MTRLNGEMMVLLLQSYLQVTKKQLKQLFLN